MTPTSPAIAEKVRELQANEDRVITALATATAALEQMVMIALDEPEQSIEVRLERFKAIKHVGRRFEFEADDQDAIIAGKVGEKFSQSYLERMNNEQFAGRRWKAQFQRVVVSRKGSEPIERYTLLELDEIDKPNP
jgi:hypothetical protein